MRKLFLAALAAFFMTCGAAHAYDGTSPQPLDLGGTSSSLTDPNADRIFFWDDSAGETDWLQLGTGLSISGTTLSLDTELSCLSGVTSAADTLPYFTGAGTCSTTTLTAFGRSLVDDADAAAAWTTIEGVERSQDAIGGILTDTSSVDFTYDDVTPSITAVALPAGITLTGDVDGAASANDLDEVSVESELESVLDGPDLQGYATGVAAWLATSSSANLAAAVTDETGSGALVFGTAPDLTISATTETNIEAALDTLANVTSIGGDVTAGGDFISTDDIISGDDVLLSNAGVINFNAGDCTLTEGTDTLTIGGTCVLVTENAGLQIGASVPFSDSVGTLTLQNVDALDATTESTIEAAIDTLANLVSVQGFTLTYSDPNADAFFGWDDSQGAWEALTASEGLEIIKTVDGSGSGLDADLLDGKTTGTSGNVVPLLDGANTWSANQIFPAAGVRIQDNVDASHELVITPTSDLTVDRVLSIATGDAARTLTLSANATLNDADYGDITTSSSFTSWQIDADAVGQAEIADDAVGIDQIDLVDSETPVNGDCLKYDTDGVNGSFETSACAAGSLPSDPDVDAIAVWDNTENATNWFSVDTGLDLNLTDSRLELDFTEISSLTWGAGAFTTMTFAAGAVDPVLTASSGRLKQTAGGFAISSNDGGTAYDNMPVQVLAESTTTAWQWAQAQYSADAVDAAFAFFKSRNATPGSHTVLNASDAIGGIYGFGSDGSNFELAGFIGLSVDGTPASGGDTTDMPGRWGICTTPDGSDAASNCWYFDNAGTLKPGTDAAFDIGTTALGVNNFHFDTGATINYENGDCILTHASNSLALTGSCVLTSDSTLDLSGVTTATLSASGANLLIEGTIAKKVGTQTIWLPAGSFTADTTTRPATFAYEINGVAHKFLGFDAASDEHVYANIAMPKGWNEGTISFQPIWTADSGSGNVIWGFQCITYSNDDPMGSGSFGTAVTSTDTLTAANDLEIGPTTSAHTIGGTPAEGDMISCLFYRDADAAGDTLGVDALLMGVKIYYTDNAANDD